MPKSLDKREGFRHTDYMSYYDDDRDYEYALQDAREEAAQERALEMWRMYGPEYYEDWMGLGICEECDSEVELDSDGVGHCEDCDCDVYQHMR